MTSRPVVGRWVLKRRVYGGDEVMWVMKELAVKEKDADDERGI